MESKKFLSAEEVASEFGLDAALLKKFVDAGEVRALADRGTWKYRRDELEDLVAEGKIPPLSADFEFEQEPVDAGSSGEMLEFIELDEDALAEQAVAEAREVSDPEVDWFVPSSEPEMAVSEELPGISSPPSSNVQSYDVAVYTGAEGTPRSEMMTSEPFEAPAIDEPASSLIQSSADVAIYAGAEGTPRSEMMTPERLEAPAIDESTSSLVQSSADVAIYTGAEGTPRSGAGLPPVAALPESSPSEVVLSSDSSASGEFGDSTSIQPPSSSDGGPTSDIAIYSGSEGTPDSDHASVSPMNLSSDISPSEISLADSNPSDQVPSFGSEFAETSDSDAHISHDDDAHFGGYRPEDSGIVLDFTIDSGATISSSGSSLRLPQLFGEAATTPMSSTEADSDVKSPEPVPEIQSSAPSQIQLPPEVAIYTGAEGTPFSEVLPGASGITSGISDSEVTMRPGWNAAERLAEVDAVFFGHNDSEVSISHDDVDYDYDALRPEDSGLVLDFTIDAGATVSSTGSSLRLPRTSNDDADEINLDDAVVEAPTRHGHMPPLPNASSSSLLQDEGSSALIIDDSNDPDMVDLSASDIDLRPDGSGVNLEGSGLRLDELSHGQPGESSYIDDLPMSSRAEFEDSGISLSSSVSSDDSGIMLEATSSSATDDSGISLESSMSGESGFLHDPESSPTGETDDSGLALEPVDSEIELSDEDSGITLSGLESGMGMRVPGSSFADFEDSEIVLDENEGTLPDGSLFRSDIEQHSDATRELQNDSSFDLSSGDATQELVLDDDEEATDFSPTVVKKGRGANRPGLSGAFELDDPATVEDLEISEALDSGVDDEVEELVDDDAVDASDEVFSGEEVETLDEDEELEPAMAAKKMSAMPREPAWGMDMTVGLVACSLFLTANVLVMWSGVSTMWTGAEPLAPAAPLIDSLAGLLGR